MNYGQCQKYLKEILVSGIKFGLDNVRQVLSALHEPQLAYPSVLVAGTNGKGSVCAMLASILSVHHLRVGLYTSPHLVRIEERIRIGEEPISSRSFCRLLTFLRETIDRLVTEGKLVTPPTHFEMLTCLAFLYFREQKADIAVLEVGMGGRLDATNVVTPLVSIITTISKDHQEFLGRTTRAIASEKAGVIKPGVPVICGLPRGRVQQVMKKRASELGAPFRGIFDGKGSFFARKSKNGHRFAFHWAGQEFRFAPALRGEYQGRNAALAVAAALELSQNWRKLEKDKILMGIIETRWPGRLEVVSRRPLVVLDGAHNEEGARALKDYVQDFLPRPLTIVFAIMKDKDIPKVIRHIFPLGQTIILTSFPFHRAASPDIVKAEASRLKGKIIVEPDPKKAVLRAFQLTPSRGALLITGSLFLVGEVKRLFPHWS